MLVDSRHFKSATLPEWWYNDSNGIWLCKRTLADLFVLASSPDEIIVDIYNERAANLYHIKNIDVDYGNNTAAMRLTNCSRTVFLTSSLHDWLSQYKGKWIGVRGYARAQEEEVETPPCASRTFELHLYQHSYWWTTDDRRSAICDTGLREYFELIPADTQTIAVQLYDQEVPNSYEITRVRVGGLAPYTLTLDDEFILKLTGYFGDWLINFKNKWLTIKEL